MNDLEKELAESIYTAAQESMHFSDRSAQAQKFRVGVSDLGFCSERLRRFLGREVPKEIDMLPAFIGTWLGEGIERAVKAANPDAIIQSEVNVSLHGEQGEYEIPGHPDIILPDRKILLDVKSAYGLEYVRRDGFEDRAKRFQRHLYGYAAWEKGVFGDCDLSEVQVGNLWIDRSAQEREFHVQLEPLSLDVIEEATQWLDEVVYAWQNGQEAPKEPPREMCAKACGFFEVCRQFDTDAEGLLTDPEVVNATELYAEALALEAKAKKLKAEAKGALTGVAGNTGKYVVRWVHINSTEVSYHRRGYDKMSITKVK